MGKKKFIVFENYQGRGEIEILKGPEIKEADDAMNIVQDEIDKRNEEQKAINKREGMGFDKEDMLTLEKCIVVKVDNGIILRQSEDEVCDIYVLEIKE